MGDINEREYEAEKEAYESALALSERTETHLRKRIAALDRALDTAKAENARLFDECESLHAAHEDLDICESENARLMEAAAAGACWRPRGRNYDAALANC